MNQLAFATKKIYRHRLTLTVSGSILSSYVYIDWFNNSSINTTPTSIRGFCQNLANSILPIMISGTNIGRAAANLPTTATSATTSTNLYYINESGTITSYNLTKDAMTAGKFTTTTFAG